MVIAAASFFFNFVVQVASICKVHEQDAAVLFRQVEHFNQVDDVWVAKFFHVSDLTSHMFLSLRILAYAIEYFDCILISVSKPCTQIHVGLATLAQSPVEVQLILILSFSEYL